MSNLFRCVIVIAVLLLAACAAPATSAPQPTAAPKPATSAPQPTAATVADDLKPPAQPYKIKIAIVNNLFGTVFWSAIEKGFFQNRGVQAQSLSFASGQEAAKAIATNDAQVGTSAMNNFQTEIAATSPSFGLFASMGNAATLINDRPLAIIAGPDTGVRAGHPEDLKGKTIGASLGGTSELYLRAVLRKAGVDVKDVKLVNVPQGNWLTSLKTKNVDAISAWEPYNTVMLKEVTGSVQVQRAGGYFGYVIFGLMTRQMIKDNPDLTLRVVAAYAEAAQWVRKNPDEAGVVASHWIQGLDPKDATAGLKNVDFDPRISKITQDAWDLSNQLLVGDAKLKAPVTMTGNFDTSYLDKVLKDHPEYFSDLAATTTVTIK